MRKRVSAIVAMISLGVLAVHAETVEVVFDASLTNGTAEAQWTYGSGFKYSTTNKEYYFGANNSQVVSPEFEFAITSVVLSVWVSTSSITDITRHLKAAPVYDGTTSTNEVEIADIAPVVDKTEAQVAWALDKKVTRFAIWTEGTSGSFYVCSAVISGVPLVAAPTGIAATKVGATRATITWANPDNAVSNAVEAIDVVTIPESYEVYESCDFSKLENTGGSNKNYTGSISGIYPQYSGTLLYAPTGDIGVLQISTGSNKGTLVHKGLGEYGGKSARITAARYSGDGTCDSYSVFYVTESGDSEIVAATNVIAEVEITSEFTTAIVDLSAIPGGCDFEISNLDSAKSGRRIWIDSIDILSGYVPEKTVTNTLETMTVAGTERATLRGLVRGSKCVVTVRAFDADGNRSKASDPLEFTLDGKDGGFAVRVR